MNLFSMPRLTIGNLQVKVPIVQGGMGVGISLAGLASAVANQGGIGVIAANAIGMIEPDYFKNGAEANVRALRNELRRARSMSDGVIGVNLMVAVNDFQKLLQVVIEEKADIVFMGAGLPIKGIPVEALRTAGVKVAPIVSSGRAAKLIFKSWEKNYHDIPDAVVVEGPKAGGHLGFSEEQLNDPQFALERLVESVVAEVREFEKTFNRAVPVIAGGGIYSGSDILEILKAGASGVQMATRFVATDECDADIRFKKAYVECREDEIIIIKSPVGMPGRAIQNSFLKNAAERSEKVRCPWRCLASCEAQEAHYCISEALDNARRGELDNGFAFAGSNVWKIDRIMPVAELVQSLKSEYELAKMRAVASFVDDFRNFRDKIGSFMDNCGTLIGARFNQMRTDYDEALEKMVQTRKEYEAAFDMRVALIREDYDQKMAALRESCEKKMTSVRADYEQSLEKAAQLKQEFMDQIEELSLQLKKIGVVH